MRRIEKNNGWNLFSAPNQNGLNMLKLSAANESGPNIPKLGSSNSYNGNNGNDFKIPQLTASNNDSNATNSTSGMQFH